MPTYKELTSRKAVLAAIAECEERGVEAFRQRYGFQAASQYVMRHEGRSYDSKAIVGVAFGYQFPEVGPLPSDSFSGGRGHAAGHLSRLGFEVEGIPPDPKDWTLAEVEAIVDIYFQAAAAHRRPGYRRKDQVEAALALVPARGSSAVERKISNICAILKLLQLPYLPGFGALGNKQTLLTALVTDWLIDHPDFFDVTAPETPRPRSSVSLEVPPPTREAFERVERERRGCRVDFADRDARNRRLGREGEAWAVEVLKEELCGQGRPDLAQAVDWSADSEGDGLGYDIKSFTTDGVPIAVEVKTTNGGQAAPFLVTANEVAASRGSMPYVLMRVFNFAAGPRFYRLHGPLEQTCHLQPRTYAAAPRG